MISGFSTRHRVEILDIGSDISDLPFLGGRDIGKSPISRKKTRYHLRCREQYQGIRLSCPEYTDIEQDIVPDDAHHQDTRTSCCCRYIRADFSPARAAAPPGPPTAALATALALQLVQPLGPRPAWTLSTPDRDSLVQRLSRTESLVQRLSTSSTETL